jgi:hypothetical protein
MGKKTIMVQFKASVCVDCGHPLEIQGRTVGSPANTINEHLKNTEQKRDWIEPSC